MSVLYNIGMLRIIIVFPNPLCFQIHSRGEYLDTLTNKLVIIFIIGKRIYILDIGLNIIPFTCKET